MKIWGKIVGGRRASSGGRSRLLGVMAATLSIGVSSRRRPTIGAGHPGLRQIAFTIGVIALGAKMARVDGEVSHDEVEAFRDFFHVPPGEERNVAALLRSRQARRSPASSPMRARSRRCFPTRRKCWRTCSKACSSIAKADGPVDAPEADYLAKVARIFGLSSERFERAKAAALGGRRVRALRRAGHRSAGDRRADPRGLAAPGAGQPSRPADCPGPARGGDARCHRKLALINDAYDRLRRERGLVAA